MADPKPPKPTVLLQLDTDPQPSVFDAMVAIDSGVDYLLRHGNVNRHDVPSLVHGLLFTRGPADLRRSAVFVGGSDLVGAQLVAAAVIETCFDPFRISVFVDPKGAHTTAAALVLAVERSLDGHSSWTDVPVVILGYGAVGRRAAYLLAVLGAKVRIFSPDLEIDLMMQAEGKGTVELVRHDPDVGLLIQGEDARVLIAAGPPGVEILPKIGGDRFPHLKVAVDLNAVPPHGLGTVEPTDAGEARDGVRCWGALGVGGLKMKIHKAIVRRLFDADPKVYDVEQVYEVGREVLAQGR